MSDEINDPPAPPPPAPPQSNIGQLVQRSIEEEMRKSYLDYSMSVIVGRALPDVRDGLKPVHRRVLFAMQDLSNTHARPYKKSARIVVTSSASITRTVISRSTTRSFAWRSRGRCARR